MDSDAKELGHVRVADRKTAWGYEEQNVIIHSCVGKNTPNRKFASDSRVNSRSQSTPTRAPSNGPRSRTNEFSGLRAIQKRRASTSSLGNADQKANSYVCLLSVRPWSPKFRAPFYRVEFLHGQGSFSDNEVFRRCLLLHQ